ncbi:7566_t:CDS:1 [Paraglomus occultum]|uniref:7566_t:CDS:1 n=1 Tax=Paraglomus occultum TaxID=144539 RepID=A0A9N9AWB9_9GLOM|nr:7566_t:CDS:1 [Paraglomus occultum]
MSGPSNNYVGLYNAVGQLEGFNSNQMTTNLQAQPYARAHATDFPLNMTSTNTDSPGQMPTNLQAQHYAQDFRSHATSLPLHGNVHMNAMHYGSTGNYITSYPSVSYYGPVSDVGASMNGQLNTSSRNKVETHKNNSCPLCGSSNRYFGTIKSIAHIFTQMRTQDNVLNEPEYVITREVRIQLVIGRVPANANFDQVLALTQQ